MKLLLHYKANPHIKDYYGNKPSSIAYNSDLKHLLLRAETAIPPPAKQGDSVRLDSAPSVEEAKVEVGDTTLLERINSKDMSVYFNYLRLFQKKMLGVTC